MGGQIGRLLPLWVHCGEARQFDVGIYEFPIRLQRAGERILRFRDAVGEFVHLPKSIPCRSIIRIRGKRRLQIRFSLSEILLHHRFLGPRKGFFRCPWCRQAGNAHYGSLYSHVWIKHDGADIHVAHGLADIQRHHAGVMPSKNGPEFAIIESHGGSGSRAGGRHGDSARRIHNRSGPAVAGIVQNVAVCANLEPKTSVRIHGGFLRPACAAKAFDDNTYRRWAAIFEHDSSAYEKGQQPPVLGLRVRSRDHARSVAIVCGGPGTAARAGAIGGTVIGTALVLASWPSWLASFPRAGPRRTTR